MNMEMQHWYWKHSIAHLINEVSCTVKMGLAENLVSFPRVTVKDWWSLSAQMMWPSSKREMIIKLHRGTMVLVSCRCPKSTSIVPFLNHFDAVIPHLQFSTRRRALSQVDEFFNTLREWRTFYEYWNAALFLHLMSKTMCFLASVVSLSLQMLMLWFQVLTL